MKLGTVLLLAQETAHRSIEHALTDNDNTLAKHPPCRPTAEKDRGTPPRAATAGSLMTVAENEMVMTIPIASTSDVLSEERSEDSVGARPRDEVWGRGRKCSCLLYTSPSPRD